MSPTPQKTYISSNGPNTERLKLVLVGNGLAGMRCLEDLLDMAPDRYDITVIGEEPWGNYNRIMLSPVLSGEKALPKLCCIQLTGMPKKAFDLLLEMLLSLSTVHVSRFIPKR